MPLPHPRTLVFAVGFVIAAASCSSPPAAPTHPAVVRLALTGTVQETAPTEATRVAGARVEAVAGPDAGRVAAADPDGRFDLGTMTMPVTVEVSRAGYVTRRVVIVSADTIVGLSPELRTIDAASADYICPTRPDHSVRRCAEMFGHPAELKYPAAVHHDGRLRVEADVLEGWDHTQSIWFDIRCRDAVVAEGRFEPFFNTATARFEPRFSTVFDAPVAGGCRYDVRVFNYGSGSYVRGRVALRVTHPS
jgi:hypothetical protein